MAREKKTKYRKAEFKAGLPRPIRPSAAERRTEALARRQGPPPQLPPSFSDVHKWPAVGEQPINDPPQVGVEESTESASSEIGQGASGSSPLDGASNLDDGIQDPHNALSSQQVLGDHKDPPTEAIEQGQDLIHITFGSIGVIWDDQATLSRQQVLGAETLEIEQGQEAEDKAAIISESADGNPQATLSRQHVSGAEASASEQKEEAEGIPEWYDTPHDGVPWDPQKAPSWKLCHDPPPVEPEALASEQKEEAEDLTDNTSESVDCYDWYDDVISKDSKTIVSRKEFNDHVESALYGESKFLSSFSFYPCISIHVFYGLKDLLLKSIGLPLLPYQPMKTVRLNLALLALPLNMMVMDIYCMMAFRKFEQGKKMKCGQKSLYFLD